MVQRCSFTTEEIKNANALLSVPGIELGIEVQNNLHNLDVLNIIDQISISCGLNREMEQIK